jgi:hypothetical protein
MGLARDDNFDGVQEMTEYVVTRFFLFFFYKNKKMV